MSVILSIYLIVTYMLSIPLVLLLCPSTGTDDRDAWIAGTIIILAPATVPTIVLMLIIYVIGFILVKLKEEKHV